MANFIESRKRQLENALTANTYNAQVAWAKKNIPEEPLYCVDRSMSVAEAELTYEELLK